MGGRGKGKRQPVAFTKPPEPAFIRRMKEQLGYQEGPNVDTKREELEKATLQDEQDKDDERPTVVVLKSGDLTADEAEKLGVFGEKDEDDIEDSSGRVVFKKPTKRPLESNKESDEIRSKLEKRESSMQKVNNKTLLSFDDEEDDDPDSD